jgi:hypothetical protein
MTKFLFSKSTQLIVLMMCLLLVAPLEYTVSGNLYLFVILALTMLLVYKNSSWAYIVGLFILYLSIYLKFDDNLFQLYYRLGIVKMELPAQHFGVGNFMFSLAALLLVVENYNLFKEQQKWKIETIRLQ